MAELDPARAAELAAAWRAIADMFEAGTVNLLPNTRMIFVRATDLGPERTAAVKAALRDVDLDVARASARDMPAPYVAHHFGEIAGAKVVLVEGLDDPTTTEGS